MGNECKITPKRMEQIVRNCLWAMTQRIEEDEFVIQVLRDVAELNEDEMRYFGYSDIYDRYFNADNEEEMR